MSEESENTVLVDRIELDLLLQQNTGLREDIISLVNVFQNITALFSGKGVMSAMPTIMKLLNDPEKLKQFEHILPIIEKYLPKPENNG